MATYWRPSLALLLCFHFSCLYTVFGTRTKEKIYIDLKSQNSCFRLLNGTHQIGCTSAQEGNVGVVHYMENDDDWDWVLKTGTTTPFSVILHSVNFTAANVRRLTGSGRVNGIAVINVNLTAPVDGFSADKSCPNDAYGYYSKDKMYQDCKAQEWNTAGHGLFFDDHGLPIFSLTEQSDVDSIINTCYIPFNKPVNGKAKSYPLCALQLQSFMSAAGDTETCIRRSDLVVNLTPVKYCDPLGDQNIVTTLKAMPNNEVRPPASVIVVGAKMDTFGMFYSEFASSDASVTGIVTLLATAKALWKLRETIEANKTALDIMFTLFQGESFDYIGSSRMVYEMNNDRFPVAFDLPSDLSKLDTLNLQRINLTHIAQFVEVSQVGLRTDGDSLWMHVDPGVRKNDTSVTSLLDALIHYGTTANLTLQDADSSGNQPLPPASVQRFLMAAENKFPSIVITDHRKQFTNKFYNSRFDVPKEIDADYPNDNSTDWYNSTTIQSNRTAALASTLARYLFQQSMGREPSSDEQDLLTADSMEVNQMYYCYLQSPHCEFFNVSVDPEDADVLKQNSKPYPFYVSVHLKTNEVTRLTARVLSYLTGQAVANATKDSCKATSSDKQVTDKTYSYWWMHGPITGPDGQRDGMCYKSTVLLSVAKSPAFDMKGYDFKSREYSSWTESIWSTFQVRVFLISSKQFQTSVLCLGVILTIFSMMLVYFIHARADVLFAHRTVSREYLYDRGL